ncbi:hypothetical protein HYQ46_000388 [Verticillium longisporum]|nr:hypothetical protein HYQ46_000388 [Verticillium longisporum]
MSFGGLEAVLLLRARPVKMCRRDVESWLGRAAPLVECCRGGAAAEPDTAPGPDVPLGLAAEFSRNSSF